MNKFTFVFFIILLGFTVNDIEKHPCQLNWDDGFGKDKAKGKMGFEYCQYLDGQSQLPYFVKGTKALPGYNYQVELTDVVFEEINGLMEEPALAAIGNEVKINTYITKSGAEYSFHVEILPFKKQDDKIYRLVKFDLKYIPIAQKANSSAQADWANSSVLKNGAWVKIKTTGKGIYKIPYSTLSSWGFANPKDVNIFGNNGYILPEENSAVQYDDLQQLSVWKGKDAGGLIVSFFIQQETQTGHLMKLVHCSGTRQIYMLHQLIIT